MTRRRIKKALLVGAAAPVVGLLLLRLGVLLFPFPKEELQSSYAQSWRFYDKHGTLLREAVSDGGMRARWTNLEKISPLVIDATIAVEDQRFFSHGGVDTIALLRALTQNLSELRTVSGASTLTMQLARLLRDHSHSIWGKMAQSVTAMRLEESLSKEEILEQYLNRAPYGAGTVGIEAASQRLFAKPSQHLSLAEAALLAGLPQAPSGLNPLRRPERARRRQHQVLQRMFALETIDEEQLTRAEAEPLTFNPQPANPLAMHFTEHILARGLKSGGVQTTLDVDLQGQIERLVRDHVQTLESGGLTQAAVVVLDNEHCDILTMVGSADYWGSDSGKVNGATSLRQPGSTLKPFTYALAFGRGYSPVSVAGDIPTQYLDAQGFLLKPKNYSQKFTGPVLMGDALGRSLNVPAIRVANALGTEDILAVLQRVGFSSFELPAEHYGLGLTLGNGEVHLLELTQAFATFARGGKTCTARATTSESTPPPRRVFSEEVSFLITHTLSDESLRIRAFGAANPLLFGFPIAVKTGTSTNWRDNWAVGYTDRHTIGVWTGDFRGNPMNQLSGAIGAGPLFHRIAKLLTQRGAVVHPPSAARPPPGVAEVLVCPLSGMAPTEHCPTAREVYVLKEDAELEPCRWHRSLTIDRRNGLLASTRCPKRWVEERVFEKLPARYASWQAQHSSHRPPTKYSPHCPARGLVANALVITHPRNDDIYVLEPGYERRTQSLQLSAEVDPAMPEVEWLIDGKRFASVEWPYEASWPLERGTHRVELAVGSTRSDAVTIEVR